MTFQVILEGLEQMLIKKLIILFELFVNLHLLEVYHILKSNFYLKSTLGGSSTSLLTVHTLLYVFTV